MWQMRENFFLNILSFSQLLIIVIHMVQFDRFF